MHPALRARKSQLKKVRSVIEAIFLPYPRRIQCNICNWEGRHFLSDAWHLHVNCPRCHSGVRQRLFFSALQNIGRLSFASLIDNRKILHFAAEDPVRLNICKRASEYVSADYLREGFDLKLDISNMPEVDDAAFDVLEHVENYQKALH